MTGSVSARSAQAILENLRTRKPGERPPPILPIEHASPAAQRPDARTPDPAPTIIATPEAPRGGDIARELARIRRDVVRLIRLAADALDSDDLAALLAAHDALAVFKRDEATFVNVTVGDAWREHRDAVQLAQDYGRAVGFLRLALDRARRVPL